MDPCTSVQFDILWVFNAKTGLECLIYPLPLISGEGPPSILQRYSGLQVVKVMTKMPEKVQKQIAQVYQRIEVRIAYSFVRLRYRELESHMQWNHI